MAKRVTPKKINNRRPAKASPAPAAAAAIAELPRVAIGPGARVRIYAGRSWANGAEGTIVAIGPDSVTVQLDHKGAPKDFPRDQVAAA